MNKSLQTFHCLYPYTAISFVHSRYAGKLPGQFAFFFVCKGVPPFFDLIDVMLTG